MPEGARARKTSGDRFALTQRSPVASSPVFQVITVVASGWSGSPAGTGLGSAVKSGLPSVLSGNEWCRPSLHAPSNKQQIEKLQESGRLSIRCTLGQS